MFWSRSHFCFSCQNWANCSMRTYEGTLVTLNTVFRQPFWNEQCRTAFFEFSSTSRQCTIFIARECGYRKIITSLCIDWLCNILNEGWARFATRFNCMIAIIYCIFPASRNIYFYQSVNTLIDSSIVHVNDILTFFTVRSYYGFFKVFNSIIYRDDFSQFEECSLRYHVDTTAQTDFGSDFRSIDDVEVQFFFCDLTT